MSIAQAPDRRGRTRDRAAEEAADALLRATPWASDRRLWARVAAYRREIARLGGTTLLVEEHSDIADLVRALRIEAGESFVLLACSVGGRTEFGGLRGSETEAQRGEAVLWHRAGDQAHELWRVEGRFVLVGSLRNPLLEGELVHIVRRDDG